MILPILGKVSPVSHHSTGQLSLILSVINHGALSKGVTKDVSYFIPVHHTCPLWPGGVRGTVVEVVEEDPKDCVKSNYTNSPSYLL